MAAPTVFDTALELLGGRFTNDPGKTTGGFRTAYAAVKLAFGVKRDDHAVAYNGSEWPKLDAEMKAAFAVLDEVTAETSERPVAFIVWCSRPERTQEEVEVVLRETARRHPEMSVAEPARRRPAHSVRDEAGKTRSLAGSGKLRWVVCSQLEVIASGRNTPLGQTVESLRPASASARPLRDSSDWDLIENLDRIIDEEAIPWERSKDAEAAIEMSLAWGVKTRDQPTYSFARFLHDFETEGGSLSEDDRALSASFKRFREAHEKDETDHNAPMLRS